MTDIIFELADRLVALDERHDELKAQAAEVWREYEDIEKQLLAAMISAECFGFDRAGKKISISDRTTFKVEDILKKDFYAAVRENDKYAEDLFDIYAPRISSKIKEWIENNEGIVPAWLEGLFEAKPKQSISIGKSTKGRKPKNNNY